MSLLYTVDFCCERHSTTKGSTMLLLAELSIRQTRGWLSSFMCTTERNAIRSFLKVRKERY